MPTQYLSTLVSYLLWPVKQVRAFFATLWSFLTRLSWTDVLIPSLVASIKWLIAQAPYALGFGPPDKQITASVALSVAAYLSGYVTAGITWTLLLVFGATALIGLARFVPVVNAYWPLARLG